LADHYIDIFMSVEGNTAVRRCVQDLSQTNVVTNTAVKCIVT